MRIINITNGPKFVKVEVVLYFRKKRMIPFG